MSLINDWKKAWRFLSVQVSSVFAAAVSAWLLLPEDQRHQLISLLPFDLGGKGPALLVLAGFVGVIFARIKSQPDLYVRPEEPPVPSDYPSGAVDIDWLRSGSGSNPPPDYRQPPAPPYPPPASADPIRAWPPAPGPATPPPKDNSP